MDQLGAIVEIIKLNSFIELARHERRNQGINMIKYSFHQPIITTTGEPVCNKSKTYPDSSQISHIKFTEQP
jgi:hypothetical protein